MAKGNTLTAEEFWARGRRVGPCLEWQGSRDSAGYGTTSFRFRSERVHRVAWLLRYGPIDAGLQVCHTCENKRCFEPLHLFVGTLADNMRDWRLRRGHPVRPAKSRVTLSPEAVREIRKMVAEGVSRAAVAEKFDIAHQTVSKVVNRERWAEVA